MPAESTWTPIATASSASNITTLSFYNIPTIYSDLVLVLNARSTANTAGAMIFNFTSGGTYSTTFLSANGSTVSSFRVTAAGAGPMLAGGPVFSTNTAPTSMVIQIPSYANTTGFKGYISRMSGDQSGSGYTQQAIGLWQKTEAIYEVLLSTGSASIYWNGSATLYGIKAA